ncbi:MAG: HEAT repeat domain-containing protein [Planctomycetes bacterium]|nr:HEAT repeat domain-containing protein [Planctomycetota bacterium]
MNSTKTLRFALFTACLACPGLSQDSGKDPGQTEKAGPIDRAGQDTETPKQDDPKQKTNEPEKVTWPAIKPVRLSITKDKIPQLVHKNEKTREKAKATIVGYGAGCAPVLLDALKHGQKPELVAELTKILDGFMEKQYVPLLEAEWTGTDEVRDAYIISTIKRFGVEGHGELFAKGLVHGDPAIRETATYALAMLGDERALHPLLLLARDSWEEKNYQIREALPKLKSETSTKWLVNHLAEGEIADRIATLRLLHSAGTKDCVRAIAPLLDAKEHLIRAEAVNALRGIMDGDPPFRKLSVFQAIEEIKKWKARVGT